MVVSLTSLGRVNEVMDMSGGEVTVYVLRAGGHVKVGLTSDLTKHLLVN